MSNPVHTKKFFKIYIGLHLKDPIKRCKTCFKDIRLLQKQNHVYKTALAKKPKIVSPQVEFSFLVSLGISSQVCHSNDLVFRIPLGKSVPLLLTYDITHER